MKLTLPKIRMDNINQKAALLVLILVIMVVNAVILYSYQRPREVSQNTGEIKEVKLKLIAIGAPDCQECFDLQTVITALKNNSKVKITSEQNLNYIDNQAQEFLQKYAITKAPVLLIDGNVDEFVTAVPFAAGSGRQLAEKLFVFDKLPPPHVEVATGTTRGLFSITYVIDKNCTECYNAPDVHRRALAGLGMKPKEEITLDRTDARELIRKYGIDSLPSILLTGDLDVYTAFLQVWPSVGSQETDGVYVFRTKGQQLLGSYVDLKTNKLVRAPAPSTNEEGGGSSN